MQYFFRNDRRTGLFTLFHGMLLQTKALHRSAENVLTDDLGKSNYERLSLLKLSLIYNICRNMLLYLEYAIMKIILEICICICAYAFSKNPVPNYYINFTIQFSKCSMRIGFSSKTLKNFL